MSSKATSSGSAARRAAARRPTRRPTQSPPLMRAMVVDALKSWVVPTAAGLVAASSWALSMAELMSESAAVTAVGLSLLVLVLFVSFGPLFFADAAERRNASIAFAAAWATILAIQFYGHNHPGPPLRQAVLHAGGEGIGLPPAGRYTLVVDGRFKPSQTQGTRRGAYRLELLADGAPPHTIEGSFEDSWARQRLGRRGSTNVEIQRTSVRHDVAAIGGTNPRVRLVDVDAALESDVQLAVYPGRAVWLLWVVGILGVVAGLALDKRFDGEGSILMAVCVSYSVVYSYVEWGSPHPQFRSLIGAVLVGGILGAPTAALLWRFVPRRWFAPR